MLDHSLVIQESAAPAAQLILLCHAAGADAASLLPLGERLRETFPLATVVSLQAPLRSTASGGFEWFASADVNEDERPLRVAQVQAQTAQWATRKDDAVSELDTLQDQAEQAEERAELLSAQSEEQLGQSPALEDTFRSAQAKANQQRSAVANAATALIGVSQGAEMVLEASKRQPMLASRVVAIGGRFTRLPETPPAVTSTHLLHGRLDAVVHYSHSVHAAHHLRDMGSDITAEVLPFIGHELHPDLIERAITKLTTHIAPHLWTAAQEAAAEKYAEDAPN